MSDEALRADALEGDKDPFAALEKDTPSESLPEKKLEKDAPEEGVNTSKEDNVPFHKHPRWIEREKELEAVKAREVEMARELEEIKASRSTPADTSIPEWFRELYGENKVAWEKYSQREQERESEITQKVIEKQQEAVAQQQAEVQRWSKWVDDEIGKLEGEGKTFDRNKLIKVMLDYRPTDEDNNFDFKKGYDIYQALEPKNDVEKSQARKELADKTTSSSKGEPKKKDFMTTNELRHKSWANL